jgi:DNA-directed RNA polymerase subunit RPC12/RpoP
MTSVAKSDLPDEFPCPTCGELREIGISKKKKPYFHCNPCGVQVFIRGQSGIERLLEIESNSELKLELKSLGIFDSCKLLQLNRQMSLIRAKFEELADDRFEFELSAAEKKTKQRLELKLSELERDYRALLTSDGKSLPKSGEEG